MPAPANPDVAWAIEDIRTNLPRRDKALSYWKGDHPLNFATTKFKNTYGELFAELTDNMCDDVVNEPTDRLQIASWGGASGDGDGPEPQPGDGAPLKVVADPVTVAAREWWEANRGDARSGSVHLNGFRAGDGFVIIWDNGDDMPRPYIQDPRQMAIRYSESFPDQAEVAAKCWRVGKGYRLNLYYPPSVDPNAEEVRGRIEHYYSRGWSNQSGEKGIPNATAFLPYTVGVEGDHGHVAPVEFHEHGFPVFHFPNGELSQYGTSVLADIYPLQDALNKVLCDFMVAGEGTSLPRRWGTGIQVLTDPVTGQEISPFQEGKNFWWTAKDTARFGQFDAAEMKGFLESMRELRMEIARKGALPAHTVNPDASGNAPSGLSLLVAEGKLIKRCKDRQRDWGVVWRELMAYALRWMGLSVVASDLDLTWAPVETRDEMALLEALALKAGLGVPQVQLLREAGYSPEQIVEFGFMSEEDRAKAMDEAAAMAGGRISTPGGPVTPPPPTGPAGADQPSTAGAA